MRLKTLAPSFLAMLLVLGVWAGEPSVEIRSGPSETKKPSVAQPKSVNTIRSTHWTNVYYSGVVVEAVKHNPLQLINPLAPLSYGRSETNVARDVITGNATGLKIFAVSY